MRTLFFKVLLLFLRRNDPQTFEFAAYGSLLFIAVGYARFSRQSGAIVFRSAVPNGRLFSRVVVLPLLLLPRSNNKLRPKRK